MTLQTNRRAFLMGASAGAAVLVVGLDPAGAFAAGDATAELNPFVRITADGTVHVVVKHFEMGQGTTTGLATLVAEELDADWETLEVDFAPADNARYANLLFGGQGTGGSTAIANSFLQYRKAGAAAREVLVAAAAEAWGVGPADVTVENGVLRSGAREAGFGEMIARAAALTPSEEPALKAAESFRLIGRDGLARKDSAAKSTGKAIFAIDVKRPGMVHAVILRAPRFGATLAGFDASGAADVTGYIGAKALPNGKGVAVYGRSTWAAMQARDRVTAEWDFADAENRDTRALVAYHQGLLDRPQYQTRAGGDLAATGRAIEGAARLVEAEFVFPHLAHAPLEPLNCVIEPTEGGGVRLHDGCQFPAITQPTVAAILGLEPAQVEIETVYAGGSFGRRATPGSDYQAEAAMAFDLLGRETPVKLVWTREDDIKGGYYRPMAAHRARIGLAEDGTILGWDHRIAVKSILKGTSFEPILVKDGIDSVSVEGVADT
ncbi:MAG: molybdopterin cofactor-binding domain-containing protein, partial [Pseudomonadota bacterium]